MNISMREDAVVTQPHPRTPNVELRRVRQSMRLSQAQFAEAIQAAGNAMGYPNHCSKRLVQKWETGEHAGCNHGYLTVLQAITGLSAVELGFRITAEESGKTIGEGIEAEPAGEPAEVARRTEVHRAMAEHASAAKAADAMAELRSVLNHPYQVDSRTVEFAATGTAMLFDLEHHTPAPLLRPVVERHLSTVSGLLTAARHDAVRRHLVNSFGRSALLAGWLAFEVGDAGAAQRYWEHSINTAQGGIDSALFAACLVHQSYAAARRDDADAAWQLAHAAVAHTSDDPRAEAWALSRVAQYAARLGEREAAEAGIRRALEISETLPNPQPGDGTEPWTRAFTRARILSSAAHTAAVLKDEKAIDYATQALEALSAPKVKSRAVVLAEVSITAAIVGELDLCVTSGREAGTLTRELDVSIAADLLHDVVAILLPRSESRAVQELLPNLRKVRRSADREYEAEDAQDGGMA